MHLAFLTCTSHWCYRYSPITLNFLRPNQSLPTEITDQQNFPAHTPAWTGTCASLRWTYITTEKLLRLVKMDNHQVSLWIHPKSLTSTIKDGYGIFKTRCEITAQNFLWNSEFNLRILISKKSQPWAICSSAKPGLWEAKALANFNNIKQLWIRKWRRNVLRKSGTRKMAMETIEDIQSIKKREPT